MLLLFLADVVRCFEADATLTGNMQDYKFTLGLTPLANLQGTCRDGDGKSASAVLHYLDPADVVSDIQSLPINLDLSKPLITVYFQTDSATFEQMRHLQRFAYSFVFGNQISIPGVITTVQIVQLNATGCWDEVHIKVDRKLHNASVLVSPVECAISTTVQAFLEYKIDNEYQRLQFLDSAQANGFNGTNYQHQDVHFFNISDSQPGADDFFRNYYVNRALEIRIVVEYSENQQTQKVIGQVTRKLTDSDCITALEPRIYYTVNGPVVRLTTVLISRCQISGDTIVGALLVSNGQDVRQFEQTMEFDDFKHTTGFLYAEDGLEWLYNAKDVSYQFYMTVFEGDTAVFEQTTAGYALISCLLRVMPMLTQSSVCMTVQILENERCSTLLGKEQQFAFSLYSDPTGNPYDRDYYIMIVSTLTPDFYLQRFCFGEESSFDISFSENHVKGSFASRLKKLKQYAASQKPMINLFESITESFTSKAADIDDFATFGIAFCIVSGVLALVIGMLAAVLARKAQ